MSVYVVDNKSENEKSDDEEFYRFVDFDAKNSSNDSLVDSQALLPRFWPKINREIDSIEVLDWKQQVLPLARIKKIMKLDDEVKMISAEVPLLFAKACEIFICELTLRACINTEKNKRRTLQRSDIALAVSKYDQFDFLIDIVPRQEIKAATATTTTTTTTTGTGVNRSKDDMVTSAVLVGSQPTHQQHLINQPQPVQYYVQVANPQVATSAQNGLQIVQAHTTGNAVTAATAAATTSVPTQIQTVHLNSINGSGAQQVPANTASSTATATSVTPTSTFQLVQQIVTADGELQHIPVSVYESSDEF